MEELIQKIERLKKENDFVILAHYYVDGAVQDIADYVGDSFYLSKVATKVEAKNILFAGVSFMGESAKLLNPEKHVYMADVKGEPFDWLYVDFQTLGLYASEYGFKAELVKEGKHYDYLAKLSLA